MKYKLREVLIRANWDYAPDTTNEVEIPENAIVITIRNFEVDDGDGDGVIIQWLEPVIMEESE